MSVHLLHYFPFKYAVRKLHAMEITEIMHNSATNAWMYVLHVQRGNTSIYFSPRGPILKTDLVMNMSSLVQAASSDTTSIMGDALTPLSSDGLMTLILADDPALWDERRQVLTQMVVDILKHPVARDMPDVL
ncbi:hypothetical protein PsorP6_004504 [Peronosclerospora sorghi]|uniref:Uncharacterized protein n=1 Tax=Peronosclerospora sorghi TaxID=230839 RepID=A0ACC0VJN1_9STRA|nr:hypothetical protein PsorP6_004504 [Peronosclerospora sorghi]